MWNRVLFWIILLILFLLELTQTYVCVYDSRGSLVELFYWRCCLVVLFAAWRWKIGYSVDWGYFTLEAGLFFVWKVIIIQIRIPSLSLMPLIPILKITLVILTLPIFIPTRRSPFLLTKTLFHKISLIKFTRVYPIQVLLLRHFTIYINLLHQFTLNTLYYQLSRPHLLQQSWSRPF